MEKQICKRCGEELPLEAFRLTKGGVRIHTCNACMTEARKAHKISSRGGGEAPFSDPDFDVQTPGEVIRLMGRAKRWLESRGYTITLKGEYKEVKVKQLKFQ